MTVSVYHFIRLKRKLCTRLPSQEIMQAGGPCTCAQAHKYLGTFHPSNMDINVQSKLAGQMPAQSDTMDPRMEVAVMPAGWDSSSRLVILLNRVMSLSMCKTL